MGQQKQVVIEETLATIAKKAGEYQNHLDKLTKRVAEYTNLSEHTGLSDAIELIVNYGLYQEKEGLTQLELRGNIRLVLTLLFSNPITNQINIPLSFWQTTLGSLIDSANQRHTPFQDVLNPSECAREAGVSRQTIYNWIEQGKLLPLWLNTHPFIRKKDLAEMVRTSIREDKLLKESASTLD